MTLRAAVRLCACAAVVGCTDPRARPVPPEVEVQFSSSFALTSPGQLLGAVHLFDDDGLLSLELSVHNDDSTFVGDSLIAFAGDPEATRPINWTVPAGIAVGSFVTVKATVKDFAGFVTSDSVRLVIQTASSGLR